MTDGYLAWLAARLSDRARARIRTVWPYLLAWLAAVLLDVGEPVASWLRDQLGLEVTTATVTAALGLALGWVVWESGRWLEARPGDGRAARAARWCGRWLVSLGLHTGQPRYLP